MRFVSIHYIVDLNTNSEPLNNQTTQFITGVALYNILQETKENEVPI